MVGQRFAVARATVTKPDESDPPPPARAVLRLKRRHPTLGRRAQSPVKKTPFCSWPIWANPLEVSPEPDKLKLPSSFCTETEMVARFEIMKSPPKPFVGSLRSEMRLATPLHWS